MQETVIKRIDMLVKSRHESYSVFAKRVGIDLSNFSKMMKGQLTISDKTLMKISRSEGVSFEWLSGMSLPSSDVSNLMPASQNTTAVPDFANVIPLCADIPNVGDRREVGCISIPGVQPAEFCIPVVGFSMPPVISEGEYIAVKPVARERYETTNPDRLYLIVTCDNERMIKRIVDVSEQDGYIVLASDNPDYPKKRLPIDLIHNIYKVLYKIKVETF